MRRLRLPVLAGLLLLVVAAAAVLAASHARLTYGTTNDEPLHLAAARELKDGRGVVSNLEHPVVMKVLAAAGLDAAPPKLLVQETRAGRRVFPYVFGGLVLVTGLWAARRAGAWAGLAAAALVALDPTARGHAAVVHNDVLLAFLLVLAGFLLDSVPRAGRTRVAFVVASGAAYGLAIATKFSALVFLAVFLGVAVVRLLSEPSSPSPRARLAPAPSRVKPALVLTAILGITALGTAELVQEAALGTTSRDALRAGIRRQFGDGGIAGQDAALRLEERLPKGAAAYTAGLLFVRASSATGTRFNYFLGKVSAHGSWLYFPVALLVKVETALVLGFLVALALSSRTLARSKLRRRAALARPFVPGALALAYLLAATATDMNIGVRHVLAVVPLGLVAALAAFRRLLRPRAAAVLLACVLAGAALEAGARWGREIPFGNLLVGGPGPGLRRVLSDSNVDWGEAQERLFARVAKGGLGRVGAVALVLNDDEAAPLGIRAVDEPASLGSFDSVAVSVHLLDVARALEKDDEPYEKTRWLKSWLPPIVREAERRAVSKEPLGDEYVIYRLSSS